LHNSDYPYVTIALRKCYQVNQMQYYQGL